MIAAVEADLAFHGDAAEHVGIGVVCVAADWSESYAVNADLWSLPNGTGTTWRVMVSCLTLGLIAEVVDTTHGPGVVGIETTAGSYRVTVDGVQIASGTWPVQAWGLWGVSLTGSGLPGATANRYTTITPGSGGPVTYQWDSSGDLAGWQDVGKQAPQVIGGELQNTGGEPYRPGQYALWQTFGP